jgi:hypothetical protein
MKARLFLKTIATCILASVLYGLIHDQITIRICPQYFTIWHPHVIETDSLTVLALVWGVIATWWMGAFLGILVGGSATFGQWPIPSFNYIFKCILWIMGASAIGAILAGLIAWQIHAIAPAFIMREQIASLDLETQRRFTIDLFIHNASYNVAPIGAIIASIFIWRRRIHLAPPTALPT